MMSSIANELTIQLTGIEVGCILGVYPEERNKTRPVVMDIHLLIERPADARDHLESTLNYEAIETLAIMTAQKGKYFLLEALAEAIAEACLRFTRVKQVWLRVCKPGALPSTTTVCVELTRRQP